MTRLLSIVALLFVSITPFATACGDDDGTTVIDGGRTDTGARDASIDGDVPPGDTGPDGGGGIPVAEYCARSPGLWCTWLEDCRGFAECATSDTDWCDVISAGVDAGRVGYDPVRAAECIALQESNAVSCEGLGPLHFCHPFFGIGMPGETCYLAFPLGDDCDPALGRCDAQPFEGSCPGTCLAWAARDTACADGAAFCAPEDFCDAAAGCTERPGEGSACQDACAQGLECLQIAGVGRCIDRGEIGEPCAADQPCAATDVCIDGSCTDFAARDGACESGQCSDADYCAANVCTALPTIGESCTLVGRCADGAACAVTTESTTYTCQPWAADGEACDPGLCNPGLWCQHSAGGNTCRPTGLGGADCAGDVPPWTPQARCADGLFCAGDDSCTPVRSAGEPCDGSSTEEQCDHGAGTHCDGSTDTCLAPGASVGVRCIGECVDGLWCNVGMCEARLANGDVCESEAACPVNSLCIALSDPATQRCVARVLCDGPS